MGFLAKSSSRLCTTARLRSLLPASAALDSTQSTSRRHLTTITAENEKERRVRGKAEDSIKDKSIFDLAKMVTREARNECGKFMDESRANYQNSWKSHYLEHGAFDYVFKFKKQEDIDKWRISTDSSYKIGKSTASLSDTRLCVTCTWPTACTDRLELRAGTSAGRTVSATRRPNT